MTEADTQATTTSTAPSHPDAAVLMLARDLHALEALSFQLTDDADALRPAGPAKVLEAASDALSSAFIALRRELALLPAMTPDGVQAEARLLWEQANIRSDDGCPDGDRELAWSLARDLLAREGTSAGAAGG